MGLQKHCETKRGIRTIKMKPKEQYIGNIAKLNCLVLRRRSHEVEEFKIDLRAADSIELDKVRLPVAT
jgi:hypothetical protein